METLHDVAGLGARATYYDRMRDKVVIVTGSGHGIGQAAALLFGREQARVVVAEHNEETGEQTTDMIRDEGGEALFVHTDVTNEDAVRSLVNTTVHAYGRLDAVINNAGIYPWLGGVVETSMEDWNETVDASLTGTFLTTKYAVPEIAKVGGGAVVNVSTIYAIAPDRGWAAYIAAKAGVIGLTKACAVDYGHLNIRFNCICPGGIISHTNWLSSTGGSAEFNPAAWKEKPLGRPASAFELASVMLFLASQESSYVTGAVIPVDGGETSLLPSALLEG